MALEKDAALAVARMALQTIEYNATCLRAVVAELDALDPADETGILERQAYALYYGGVYEQALPRFRALVAVTRSANHLVKYAQLLLARHDYEEAFAASEEALKLEPKHHLALQTCAIALFSLGRFAEALPLAEEAASLRDDPRSTALASLAASQLGRQTSARALSRPQERFADILKKFGETGLGQDKILPFIWRIEAFAVPL